MKNPRYYCKTALFSILLTTAFLGNAFAQVATPTLSPGTGTYTSPQTVTLNTATENASIRYTTNGTTPSDTVGTIYTTPVSVSTTQTLKAIAYLSGMSNSAVVTGTYTIVAPPVVTSFSPSSGAPGTQITISGSGFGTTRGSGALWLGSAPGTISSWSNTQIIATIAANSRSGSVRVKQNGTWSESLSIDVTDIAISGISPESGLPGTSVTISGSGFGSTQGSGQVVLGTTTATVQSWSATQIVVTAPAADGWADIRVLQTGRTSNPISFYSTNPKVFSVTPASATVGTTVTIEGEGFGSTQGTGSLQLGSKNATILTWTDTEITGVVATGAVGGIVRVQKNSFSSKPLNFDVPNGNGDIVRLFPSILNLAVGETRILQALDADGAPVTGLTWASSDTSVVSLSGSNPPVLTALAVGHVTITAGLASADITVSAGALPEGTVTWSNTIGGQSLDSMLPAVPSALGVADVFAIHYVDSATETVHAITNDGSTAWTAAFENESLTNTVDLLIPDFQGGLIDVHYTYRNAGNQTGFSYSVTKVDGLTGQLGTPYTSDETARIGDQVALHPDGTVFVLEGNSCADICANALVGIDSATGEEKFNIAIGDWTQTGNLIIAGDGNAYVPYTTIEGLGGGGGLFITRHHMKLLRVSTSGTVDRIPVHDWDGYFQEIDFTGGQLISNGDTGVLLTWQGIGLNELFVGMAVTNGTSVSVVTGPLVPGGQVITPALQAEDGSFVGTVAFENDPSSMIAFDATGNVRWTVPNEIPMIATADGGVIAESGVQYDSSGNASGSGIIVSWAYKPGWLGNILGTVYSQRVDQPLSQNKGPNTEYAPTFAARVPPPCQHE